MKVKSHSITFQMHLVLRSMKGRDPLRTRGRAVLLVHPPSCMSWGAIFIHLFFLMLLKLKYNLSFPILWCLRSHCDYRYDHEKQHLVLVVKECRVSLYCCCLPNIYQTWTFWDPSYIPSPSQILKKLQLYVNAYPHIPRLKNQSMWKVTIAC